VHAPCLTQWLQHSGNTHCEVREGVERGFLMCFERPGRGEG
jgi:hypothetical protein